MQKCGSEFSAEKLTAWFAGHVGRLVNDEPKLLALWELIESEGLKDEVDSFIWQSALEDEAQAEEDEEQAADYHEEQEAISGHRYAFKGQSAFND